MGLKKGVRAQYSFEFLMVLAFAFVIISGITYVLIHNISNANDGMKLSQSKKVGENLMTVAKDASRVSGYYKKTVHLVVPDGLTDIQEESGNLIMNVSTSKGDENLFMKEKFFFVTKIDPDEIQGGVFTVEKMNDIIVICTGTSCECEPIESGPIMCTDGIDNDCNGYIDTDDMPCFGYITDYFYGYAYSENAGFISFNGSGYKVGIIGTSFTGYAYGENFGYISFNGPGYGVSLSGANLVGYAYSENVGYISFDGAGYGVQKQADNNLTGYAYSENVGYIKFNDTVVGYGVKYLD